MLATQRPSVDVITGLIKANVPARISFQVTSRIDSRTILDSIGAERLLGEGDMLFMPPSSARLTRIHGAFVSEPEIRKVVGYLKDQSRPVFDQEFTRAIDEAHEQKADELEDDSLADDMYDQAVELVAESQQASISWLQRRLRVGYNRAARMIERMEKEGLVSPADGVRPREVRMRRSELRGRGSRSSVARPCFSPRASRSARQPRRRHRRSPTSSASCKRVTTRPKISPPTSLRRLRPPRSVSPCSRRGRSSSSARDACVGNFSSRKSRQSSRMKSG
jgi:hypothetical protein